MGNNYEWEYNYGEVEEKINQLGSTFFRITYLHLVLR
jgi:hypothetical protein